MERSAADVSQVQFPTINVGSNDFDFDNIAQAKGVASPSAGQSVRLRLVQVVIVLKRCDVDKPFTREFDALSEEAEVFDARNNGGELHSQILLQVS